jgi:hypothetical protein
LTDQTQLREKLPKLEALFAGAGTLGEEQAAEAELALIRARRKSWSSDLSPGNLAPPARENG